MFEHPSSRSHRFRPLALLLVLAGASAACDDKSDDEGSSQPTTQDSPPASGGGSDTGSTGNTADPQRPPTQDGATPGTGSGSADGTYVADVTANGTGCPPGSWTTQIADDKKSFTITFSGYQAEVTPSTMLSVKDCQLAINLKARKQVAYAVQSFSYDGHAFLEQGVNAKLEASYYFQGNPVDDVEQRVDVTGPHDKDFSFRQSIGLPEQVWSSCGLDRELNVRTLVRLRNAEPRRSGRVNVSQGSSSSKLFIALNERPCP